MEMSKRGKGTADHILPLGDWFSLSLSYHGLPDYRTERPSSEYFRLSAQPSRHIGYRMQEAGSREPEADSGMPEAESQEPEADSGMPEAESQKPEAGSGMPDAGRLTTKASKRKLFSFSPIFATRRFLGGATKPKAAQGNPRQLKAAQGSPRQPKAA